MNINEYSRWRPHTERLPDWTKENQRIGQIDMGSEQEKARLLKLYQSSLQAHFEQDASTFLAEYAPNWYAVSNGTMRFRTKEEALPGVEDHFQRTHFADISQITAPIVHISAEASMAWMLAEIRVRAVQTQPDGQYATSPSAAPGSPSMKKTKTNGRRSSMLPVSSSLPMARRKDRGTSW